MNQIFGGRFVEQNQGNLMQWRDRWGRVPPETSDREISADVSGKERQGK